MSILKIKLESICINSILLFWMSFISFSILTFSIEARSETFQRRVEFEWEVIDGAVTYDIEVQPNKGKGIESKKYSFRTEVSKWQGKLAPGDYLVRLRARDNRGVPGDWGAPFDFRVGLDDIKLISPPNQSEVSSNQIEKDNVLLKWKPVQGATKYDLLIQDEDGKDIVKEQLKDIEYMANIPVAKKYQWRVMASDDDGHTSEGVAQATFMVTGASLSTPIINKPESEFVRELKWDKVERAEKYDVKLMRKDPISKKWTQKEGLENYQDTTIPFSEKLPGGEYQLQVYAKGSMRKDSQMGRLNFKVRNGSRTPASEFQALVRKSIDRVEGWYGIASYLITQINFNGSNFETGGASNFQALGGTGRLGLGYQRSESSWGFLSIVDLSGFFYNGTNHTFSSAEGNATYKIDFGRGELRFFGGLYMKELPNITGNPATLTVDRESRVSVMGPHIAAELMYSLSPKLGIQFNAHTYYALQKISTPNGEPISPTLSYQIGFMGSYRITPRFTGLMGYAKRVDKLAYKAQTGGTSLAEPGEVNSATVAGDYLNFYAEWDF